MAYDPLAGLIMGLYALILLTGALNLLQSMKVQKLVEDLGELQNNVAQSSETMKALSKRFEGIKALLKEDE